MKFDWDVYTVQRRVDKYEEKEKRRKKRRRKKKLKCRSQNKSTSK